MQVTIFKDRKPTDTKVEVKNIDNSSLASLIASLGGEGNAKAMLEQLVRQTFQVAYTKASAVEGFNSAAFAASWKPGSTGTRSRKTAEQKIREFAAKLGLTDEQLRGLVAAQSATAAAPRKVA